MDVVAEFIHSRDFLEYLKPDDALQTATAVRDQASHRDLEDRCNQLLVSRRSPCSENADGNPSRENR
jgi:hypothetical protein